MSGEPVVSKDQRAGRIKWSDIEVQIYTITSGKNYGQVGNFRDGAVWWTIKQVESNRRSCRCLQMVSIHKFRVKDQERSKRNKEWMRIRKSRCVESDGTHCCTGKFNMALSLCGVLGVTLYFSEDFSEVATGVLTVAKVSQPLGQESSLWSPVLQ